MLQRLYAPASRHGIVVLNETVVQGTRGPTTQAASLAQRDPREHMQSRGIISPALFRRSLLAGEG